MQRRLQLGFIETQLFAWAQLHEKQLVYSREAAKALGLSAGRAAKLFSRMAQKGLVLRLLNGVYLVPPKFPPGGRWGADPYVVLARLMDAVGAAYQITGDDAFHRHGFSQQVPNTIAAYNTKISGRKVLGGISYQLIKVNRSRLGAVSHIKLKSGERIPFSAPGRTLLDALYDWSRFGTIPRVFDWLRERIQDKALLRSVIAAALTFGDMGSVRRLGYILADAGLSRRQLGALQARITHPRSYLPLSPNRPKRGRIDRTWGLVINV